MTTLPADTDTGPISGHTAAARMRDLLRALGADHDLTRRVHGDWSTETGVPHVYVPPLPAALIGRLLDMLPPEATL